MMYKRQATFRSNTGFGPSDAISAAFSRHRGNSAAFGVNAGSRQAERQNDRCLLATNGFFLS